MWETADAPASIADIEMQRMESGDEHLCFVCMEACEEKSKCKCTDRYVHDACLLRWLKTNNTGHCPVCLEQYPNVDVKTKTSRCVEPLLIGVVCGFLGFVLLIIFGSLALANHFSPDYMQPNIILALGIMLVAFSVLGLFICLMSAYRFRTQGHSFWRTRRTQSVVMNGP